MTNIPKESIDSLIYAPAFELAESGKFICPECSKEYASNWIKRHLIWVHDWRLYEDGNTLTDIVYKHKGSGGDL